MLAAGDPCIKGQMSRLHRECGCSDEAAENTSSWAPVYHVFAFKHRGQKRFLVALK